MSTTQPTDVIDRDTPCVCGGLAARQLRDGSLECPRCGRVTDAEVAQ
jgi:transposase